MTRRPYEEKMHLDMPFDEAVERFIGVDPAEYQANVDKAKQAKPPAERGRRSAGKPDSQNVTKLRGKAKPANR
jgi:hypothetical protein